MIRKLFLFKIKYYLKRNRTPGRMVLSLLVILSAIIYGLSYQILKQMCESGIVENLSANDTMKYTLLLIFAVSIGRMIFPAYKPITLLYPKFYPSPTSHRYVASVINELTQPFFFYMLIFIVSGSLFTKTPDFEFLCLAVLFMVGGHLLRRSIQYFIDFKLTLMGKLSMIVILLVMSLFVVIKIRFHDPFFVFGTVLLLFIAGWVQHLSIKESTAKKTNHKSTNYGMMLKILLHNPGLRLPLLIGLAVKTIFLLIDLYLYHKKGSHLFNGDAVYWLFIPPLIYFTYIFNNIWGFCFNLWLNLQLRVESYLPFVAKSFILMLPLLIIDLLITLPLLWMGHDDKIFVLTFYFATTLSLLLLSFMWSLVTPKKVTTTFQLNGSTSNTGVLVMMVIIFIMAGISKYKEVYLFVPVLVLLSAAGFRYSLVSFKKRKYILFEKLQKG